MTRGFGYLAIVLTMVWLGTTGCARMGGGSAVAPAGADATVEADASSEAPAGESAQSEGGGAEGSNPLASVRKLDLSWDFIDADAGEIDTLSAKGSFMLHPKMKLNYEGYYQYSNLSGSDEDDFESVALKPIWFPYDRKVGDNWGMRTALGLEWMLDLGDRDKRIGEDCDRLAPLAGLAFVNKKHGLTLIPLVQHFESYNGADYSATAARLIALKSLPNAMWLKLDAIAMGDWEQDTTPINTELELGKMFTPKYGVFVKGLSGFGGDRLFDWGVGAGLRFMF